MTWRLEIVHRTQYDYSSKVASSYNEARVTPTSEAHQSVVSARFNTVPQAAVRRYRDYWGTQVSEFDVIESHDTLVVTSSVIVETEEAEELAVSVEWEELADPDLTDRYAELLMPTIYTAPEPALAEGARRLAATCETPADAVFAVSRWVNDEMSYVPGATGVHTDASEAWEARRGVCQDFAHVMIVALRVLGIPARYVSGYLHPSKDVAIGEERAGESHAWVEAWTGSWWGVDPTNLEPIGHRHVALARGRDYADVAPVRGVHSGGGEAKLTVEVRSTRLR
jgi:transglutaminase-like putative cysteine protease